MRKKNKKKDLMIKRKVRLKKRRKKFLIASVAFLSFAIIFTSLFYKLYVNSKCKDLSYAINYTLTNTADKDQRLLDIKKSNLVFQDEDTAIVEASGFAKKKPHSNTSIKGHFKKTTSGVWQLSKTSLIPL